MSEKAKSQHGFVGGPGSIAALVLFGVGIGVLLVTYLLGNFPPDRLEFAFLAFGLLLIELSLAARFALHERWEERHLNVVAAQSQQAVADAMKIGNELTQKFLSVMETYDTSHAGLERTVRENGVRISDAEAGLGDHRGRLDHLTRRVDHIEDRIGIRREPAVKK